MQIIIDGDYNKELISQIKRKDLPVSHIIVHVPQNPIGNSSIFLPEILPSLKEFRDYTKIIQDNGIIPIAGIDSTCQGNLEAHAKQNKAINILFENLHELEYSNYLISSPNNAAFINANFPEDKIYLSYSQYITSLNRAKIFFELGVDNIIIHPDIIRNFNILKNFLKLKQNLNNNEKIDYILPLNLGCNWGCIHWYEHHNLQSHRTIKSSILPNQNNISDIEDEFDYPILDCWRKRLKQPSEILKAGWISPFNIQLYHDLGYEKFVLFTSRFSTEKILNIIKSYIDKLHMDDFKEFLNIPQPYGDYWSGEEIHNSMIFLDPNNIREFCDNFPYNTHYPFEKQINEYCNKYIDKFNNKHIKEREEILKIIMEKKEKLYKGVFNG